jgi:enoyl-CoA hydratase/carnithine racemase
MAEIELARDGAVLAVTLNRPQRRNALTLAMWQELRRLAEEAGADDSVRALVLTGAGEHFCAGADIAEFGANRADLAQTRAYDELVDEACAAFGRVPKPVIAAIRGFCLGGGTGVALACDFRIAAPDARFGIPAARLGIVYGLAETQSLLATVGLPRAKRLLFTAERIPAEEARRIGLVDEIAADPLEAARAMAATMAANAPLSIAGAKAILNGLAAGTLAAEEAHALSGRASESEDYREGRTAFLEKRAPVFRGR